MRFSRMVSKTLRSDPPDAETASHRLLLRAGMIHQVASGVYSYLPLALRSLRKIENIIREEMDAAGGQELMMPALQPQELWEQTGRREAFGDNTDTDLVLLSCVEDPGTFSQWRNWDPNRLPVDLTEYEQAK